MASTGGVQTENRATELRLGPKGRAVFTTAGWNACQREAGIAAGNWWIAHYGPLRWNYGYALGQLHYRGNNARSPFYRTGRWLANFNSRAYTKAVSTRGGARFGIICPVGHFIRPETAEDFRTIPARESVAVSREYRRAIIQALQAQRVTMAARRHAIAVKRSEARAAKASATRSARNERRRSAYRSTP